MKGVCLIRNQPTTKQSFDSLRMIIRYFFYMDKSGLIDHVDLDKQKKTCTCLGIPSYLAITTLNMYNVKIKLINVNKCLSGIQYVQYFHQKIWYCYSFVCGLHFFYYVCIYNTKTINFFEADICTYTTKIIIDFIKIRLVSV